MVISINLIIIMTLNLFGVLLLLQFFLQFSVSKVRFLNNLKIPFGSNEDQLILRVVLKLRILHLKKKK